MNRTVLFRADGGHGVGFGHIKRCLSLASELTRENAVCKFACRCGNPAVSALIRASGFGILDLPDQVNLIAELEILNDDDRFNCDVIVLDISHRETVHDIKSLSAYIAGLKQRFPAVAIIDGHMDLCLAGLFDLPVDLVVLPYVAADEQVVLSRSSRTARGPDYFVLDDAYAAAAGETFAKSAGSARKLLVTAGGSDPSGITLKTLKALDRLEELRLEVRVVIGPAFAENIVVATTEWARTTNHQVTIVDQPENLTPHIAWCDLAVSASGLTKYELAIMGKPAILLSIDDNHATFNVPFDEYGTANHLGPVRHVTVAFLSDSIERLLADRRKRSTMSSAGRAVLDGRGAARLAAAIIATTRSTPIQGGEIRIAEASI